MPQEVVFCAAAPSSPGTGSGAISLHDIETSVLLASFKQTNASTGCTAFLPSNHAQGGFILAAQPDKPILNVYNFQKDQLALKIVLPERLCCVALDDRGDFCAGGTTHGRIFLWEVASGILYNAWDAHYRQVTVLRFTHDSAALISGSDDSGVIVWLMSSLIDDDLQNDFPEPYCGLSDHTLSVTDIVCGAGSFPRCRVLTSSVDAFVKLWDLSSRKNPLLVTFQFPKPISCLAWDLTERFFFAASRDEDGSIHQMDLYRQREDGLSVEAVGGTNVGHVERAGFGETDTAKRNKRLMLAGSAVTCISISMSSSLVLAGTTAGLVQVFDVESRQFLRSITTYKDKGLRITTVATMLKPLDLIGHVSLSVDVSDGFALHVKPVAPFMKVKDAKAREKKEIWISGGDGYTDKPDDSTSFSQSILLDHAFFLDASGAKASSASATASTSDSLQSEVLLLREQLGKAKAINDAMWERIVQKVFLGEMEPSHSEEIESAGDERRASKRSRA